MTLFDAQKAVETTRDDLYEINKLAEESEVLLGSLAHSLDLQDDREYPSEHSKTCFYVGYKNILRFYDMLSSHLNKIISITKKEVDI